MTWYLVVALFAFVAPFLLRSFQDRIPYRASHQTLVLSLMWLGIQLADPGRPSDKKLLAGWLFIYGFGALTLLFGRVDD
ncbi:MAG: hypothetical protein LBT08_09860 [Synergistaceae bacterium]|jgi:hypothetical protein|nr:hypothetical protein [Synergistaceae bacterium]